MTDHNCLIIKKSPTDYLQGDGHIPLKSNVPSGDWSHYLDFFERQRTDTYDTNGCVCFSAQEDFDAQMDYLISSKQISTEMVNQFTSLGYMDTGLDGQPHFHSSPRFIQIMTGNGFNGNSCQDAWDAMRQYGVLPWKDLPFDDSVPQTEYLNPVGVSLSQLKQKASQFIDLIGGRTITGKSSAISYHWVVNDAANNLPAMQSALAQAPLCMGIDVGPNWNVAQPTPPVPGGAPGHCVMNYLIDNFVEIYDHYVPAKKQLAKIWPMPYVLQGVVTITPPIVVPPLPAPLPPQPTPTQEQTWLQAVSQWLQNILNQLKGRQLSSNQMNYSLFSSRTFWVLVAVFLYNGYAAISGQLPPDVTVVVNLVFSVLGSYFHIDGIKSAQLNGAMSAKNLPPQA